MFHFSGCRVHKPMYSAYDDKVLTLSGYPIRIPPGLSSLAALRGFSQLVASFFACQHQGIHHKPLGSLYRIQPPVTRISKSFSRLIQSFANPLFLCMLDSYVICVSALPFGNCYFPQNCWSTNLAIGIYIILPRGCQSAAFRLISSCILKRGIYGW